MAGGVVVVGGGFAGRMATVRLRKAGHEVTVVDALEAAVERTRLHQAAVSGYDVAIPLGPWLEQVGARSVTGRVTRIGDAAIGLADGRELPFDQLVVTAGSEAVTPTVPGGSHAIALTTPADAARVRAAVDALPDGAGVAIVGAGLTGIELATEVAEVHPRLAVSLIGPLGDGFGASAVDVLARSFRDLGVRHVPAFARAIDADGVDTDGVDTDGVDTDDGRVEARLVVWVAGMRAPRWLADAGLPVDASGRIAVGPTLQVVGRPNVVAAGDCAATGLRMACATAMPTGCHAADTVHRLATGQAPTEMGFAYVLRCVSLGRRRGLIQGVDAADAPTWALGGRTAAGVKEAILRVAAAVHRWEHASGVPLYGWPRRLPLLAERAAAQGAMGRAEA